MGMLALPGCSLEHPEIIHFSQKNACFGVESMIILCFWAFFHFGRAWTQQNEFEVDFGRWESLHVIESTSFSSQTGPQRPENSPGDPQQASPGVKKKIQYFFKPFWGGPGGSPGVLGRSWGAVGLETLIDSMTCKLSPATKIDLEPVWLRSGMVQKSKKNT